MSNGKFITSKQAAERLGFSPDYIRRMCVKGKIKAEKLGNTWVTTHSALKNIKRTRFKQEQKDGIGSEE